MRESYLLDIGGIVLVVSATVLPLTRARRWRQERGVVEGHVQALEAGAMIAWVFSVLLSTAADRLLGKMIVPLKYTSKNRCLDLFWFLLSAIVALSAILDNNSLEPVSRGCNGTTRRCLSSESYGTLTASELVTVPQGDLEQQIESKAGGEKEVVRRYLLYARIVPIMMYAFAVGIHVGIRQRNLAGYASLALLKVVEATVVGSMYRRRGRWGASQTTYILSAPLGIMLSTAVNGAAGLSEVLEGVLAFLVCGVVMYNTLIAAAERFDKTWAASKYVSALIGQASITLVKLTI